ncbi:hypothetical protein ABG972_03175, partial [Collinsella aerofaciens]
STFSLLYMRTSSPDRPAVQLSVRTPNKNADGIIMHDAEQTPFSRVIGVVSFCVPYLGFVNAYCTTMPGLFVVVAVLALLVAVSIVLDRMVPDEPAGNHARAHAKGRRS